MTKPRAAAQTQPRKREMGPATERVVRTTVAAVQYGPQRLFPQWLRTAVIVFIWLASTLFYIQLISPYVTYRSAMMMSVGLAISGGIAVHLWPTRTSPWRTLVWAWFGSAIVGSMLLLSGAGTLALTGATITGFGIVAARANGNARRLVELFQTWRAVR